MNRNLMHVCCLMSDLKRTNVANPGQPIGSQLPYEPDITGMASDQSSAIGQNMSADIDSLGLEHSSK